MSSDDVLIIVSLRTASLACCIVSACLGIQLFNYREDVALLLCALHCNQQDSPDGNNSGLRVSLYLWKRTYSSLRAVKNIMFAGVFMCPKNRTEVNISPVCRGGNAQNRAVNDTGRLRDTPR
jgi:hypothetical protein